MQNNNLKQYIKDITGEHTLKQPIINNKSSYFNQKRTISAIELNEYKNTNFKNFTIPLFSCDSNFLKRAIRDNKLFINYICGNQYENEYPKIKIYNLKYNDLWNYKFLSINLNESSITQYSKPKFLVGITQEHIIYRTLFTNINGKELILKIADYNTNFLKPYIINNALIVNQMIFVDRSSSEYFLNHNKNGNKISYCQFKIYDFKLKCTLEYNPFFNSKYDPIFSKKEKDITYPECQEEIIQEKCINFQEFNIKEFGVFFNLIENDNEKIVFYKSKNNIIKECDYSTLNNIQDARLVYDKNNQCYFKENLSKPNLIYYLSGLTLFAVIIIFAFKIIDFLKKIKSTTYQNQTLKTNQPTNGVEQTLEQSNLLDQNNSLNTKPNIDVILKNISTYSSRIEI